MKKVLSVTICLLFVSFIYAQNNTAKFLSFSGYGELYYSYDFDNPAHHEKPSFIYNHKRHNELNANLLLVKANYDNNKNCRANVALMAGNYAQYNLSSEPNWAQFIYEANVGIKLSTTKNIWLDAGIMPSHIGFESAISADCWTLTRSLPAENSPYYETGVKLSYTTANNQLLLSALLLNGWQKINKPNYIQQPSAGIQINYKPNDKLTINYSNFIGTDKPDSLNAFRLYHNLYAQYQPCKNFGVIAGFDIGSEKQINKQNAVWYSPVLIVKQQVNTQTAVACRAEYYKDDKQIIINTETPNGFNTLGFSSNVDYQINPQTCFRFEAKFYHSKDEIFNQNKNNNFSLTTNLTFKL